MNSIIINNDQDFIDWQDNLLHGLGALHYRFIPLFDPDGELEASQWVPEKYPAKLNFDIKILYNELYEISFDFS